MAHAYSNLFAIPTTGLRFFTVYGPWGRPDMALFLFTKAILAGEPIDVFNEGKMQRDFTYIDDIVEGVVRVLDRPPGPDPSWNGAAPDPASSFAPYRLYNIGNNQPVELLEFVAAHREGDRADGDAEPAAPASPATFPRRTPTSTTSHATSASRRTRRSKKASRDFVDWYRDYYG